MKRRFRLLIHAFADRHDPSKFVRRQNLLQRASATRYSSRSLLCFPRKAAIRWGKAIRGETVTCHPPYLFHPHISLLLGPSNPDRRHRSLGHEFSDGLLAWMGRSGAGDREKWGRGTHFSLERPPSWINLGNMRAALPIERCPTERRPLERRLLTNLCEMLVAVPILAITGLGLVQFIWLLAAGEALGQAAEAGAQEAVLPKATFQSVSDAVRRRLDPWGSAGGARQILVQVGGRAAYGVLQPRSGDEIVVTVCVASHAAVPDLLGSLGLPLFGEKLHGRRALRVP